MASGLIESSKFDVSGHDTYTSTASNVLVRYNREGGWVFGELDSEGAPGQWSLQARFFDANGTDVGVAEAISVTVPGHTWSKIHGKVTKPITTAVTMQVELVSAETSGWVTSDGIFALEAPSPLIPPPPTSVKYYYPSAGSGHASVVSASPCAERRSTAVRANSSTCIRTILAAPDW